MSSKNKTSNLNLNLWDGSDKPKREDFNYDNEIIDSAIGAHINNTSIHLTEDEIAQISSRFVVGSYIGDSASSRTLSLDFTPSFVFAFSSNSTFSVYDKDTNKMYAFAAAATKAYGSSGIKIGENSFTVTESTGVASFGNCYPRMNTSGYRYQYIAFR